MQRVWSGCVVREGRRMCLPASIWKDVTGFVNVPPTLPWNCGVPLSTLSFVMNGESPLKIIPWDSHWFVMLVPCGYSSK